jgi:hypothetical protein
MTLTPLRPRTTRFVTSRLLGSFGRFMNTNDAATVWRELDLRPLLRRGVFYVAFDEQWFFDPRIDWESEWI